MDLLTACSSALGRSFTVIDEQVVGSLYDELLSGRQQLEKFQNALTSCQRTIVEKESALKRVEKMASDSEDMQARVVALQAENEKLARQHQQEAEANQTLRAELKGLQTSVHSVEQQCEHLLQQKNVLLESLEGKQDQIEALSMQTYAIKQSSSEKASEVQRHALDVISKNKELGQLQLQLTQAASQIEQFKSAEKWYADELERLGVSLSQTRKEKISTISELRNQVEHSRSLVDSLQAELSEQRIANSSLQNDLRQAHSLVDQCTAQQRDLDRIGSSCIEEDDDEEEREQVESMRQELISLSRENESLRQRLGEMDHALEKFQVSPTAASMDAIQQAKENQHVQNEVSILRAENERLKANLQDICRDVDEQIVCIQKEKRDNDRLCSELGILSQQVLELSHQTEQQAVLINDLQLIKAQLQESNHVYQAQLEELMRMSSQFHDTAFDNKQLAIISSLQRRNQELSEKLARATDDSVLKSLRSQLDEAMNHIRRLSGQRDRQTSLLESLSLGKKAVVADSVNQRPLELVKLEAELQNAISRGHLLQSQNEDYKQQIRRIHVLQEEQSREIIRLQAQLEQAHHQLLEAKESTQHEALAHQRLQIQLSVSDESQKRLYKNLDESNEERERLFNLISSLRSSLKENEASLIELQRVISNLADEKAALVANNEQGDTRLAAIQAELVNAQLLLKNKEEECNDLGKSLDDLKRQLIEEHQTRFDVQRLQRESADSGYEELLNAFNALKDAKDKQVEELHTKVQQTEFLQSQVEQFKAQIELAIAMEQAFNELKQQHEALQEEFQSVSNSLNSVNEKLIQRETSVRDLKLRANDLEASKDSLANEADRLKASVADIKEDYEKRIAALKAHNDELTQILATKDNPTTESTSGYDPVITIVRQQKDMLQAEYEKSQQECRRLQARMEHVQRNLDEAQATLQSERASHGSMQGMAADFSRLKQQYEQLLVFRDTNNTLRQENVTLNERIIDMEREIADVRQASLPLQQQLRDLRAELAAKQRQVELLQQQRKDNTTDAEKAALETRLNDQEVRQKRMMLLINQLRTDNASLKEELVKNQSAPLVDDSQTKELENRIKEHEMKNTLLIQTVKNLRNELESLKAPNHSAQQSPVKDSEIESSFSEQPVSSAEEIEPEDKERELFNELIEVPEVPSSDIVEQVEVYNESDDEDEEAEQHNVVIEEAKPASQPAPLRRGGTLFTDACSD
jgi:nucleoprotein TPR